MARAGRWFRSFFGGKKDKGGKEEEESKNCRQECRQKQQPNDSPAPSPGGRERRRWSFRRSTNATKTKEPVSTMLLEAEDERTTHAMAVAAATKAAADAAAAAAHAAAVVIRLTGAAKCRLSAAEGAAAVKIQSSFRSYLDMRSNSLENVKTVDMDLHGAKWSSRVETPDRYSPRYRLHYRQRQQQQQHISPSASSLTDMSLMTPGAHFEDSSSFRTADSSTYYYSPMSSAHDSIKENSCVVPDVCGSYPNYMANTESSKAKARSHSTPRQRPSNPRRGPSIGSPVDGCQLWKDTGYKSLVPY